MKPHPYIKRNRRRLRERQRDAIVDAWLLSPSKADDLKTMTSLFREAMRMMFVPCANRRASDLAVRAFALTRDMTV